MAVGTPSLAAACTPSQIASTASPKGAPCGLAGGECDSGIGLGGGAPVADCKAG